MARGGGQVVLWLALSGCQGTAPASAESSGLADSHQPAEDSSGPGSPTDPDAVSDSDAVSDTDGGSPVVHGVCANFAPAASTGRVDDDQLNEISGVVVSRQHPGIFWVLEDSGNEPELYGLDESGHTRVTLKITGVENGDWEDLAIAPCGSGDWCLWIGDIGNNSRLRNDLSLLRVREPASLDDSVLSADAVRFPLRYPGDAEDAEGLAILGDGRPLIVTKRSNASAGLFTLEVGAEVLTHQADLPTGVVGEDLSARATAAEVSPDGARLLMRTYSHLFEVDITDLTAPTRTLTLVPGLELQGEAAAYDPVAGGVRHVAEGNAPKLYFASCR